MWLKNGYFVLDTQAGEIRHEVVYLRVPKQWPHWARKAGMSLYRVPDKGRKRCVFVYDGSTTISPAPDGMIELMSHSGQRVLCPVPQTEAEFMQLIFSARI